MKSAVAVNKANGQSGFTLLEVLLAIVIFSIISLSSFTIFNTVLTSDETSRVKTERLNEIQRAFLLIERDITQIARRKVRLNGEGSIDAYVHTTGDSFSSSTQALGFVKHGWTNPGLVLPRSDLQTVGYQVSEGTFERIHFNFVDPVLGEEPKVRKLLTDVIEVKFAFHDGREWREELQDKVFPVAIAIEFELEDLGVIRRQFLVPGDATSETRN